jgi:outer membrane protein assembly factor BamB
MNALGGDWPQFRGPDGQGHSDEASVPVEWSVDQNIAWKTELPGDGWSSPIVWRGRVYLTSAVPVEGGAINARRLAATCIDAKSGKVVWSKTIFEIDDVGRIHSKNSNATPTPITDGRRLFVHFGTQGTACLSLDGEMLWETKELKYKPVHGGGSSPVLVDDLLVVSCDGSDVQFIAALNQSDGKLRWKKERPPIETSKGFSFCTPLVIDEGGRKQIVSPAADQVIGYSTTGDELWRFLYSGYSVVPRPVFGDGLLYFSTSFDDPVLYALKLERGQTEPSIAWSRDKGAPSTPSPLLVGSELYVVSDRGVGTCLDAKSGEELWTERLGGNFSASPVFAGGFVYFQNEDGETIVIRPGTAYQEVARNSLPGKTLASLAVSDSAIYLRTDTHLYRISRR